MSTLTSQQVTAFKRDCQENTIIATTLKERLGDWIDDPILDVGCGIGDIALQAFPNKRAILLDTLDFVDYPLAKWHERVRIDFFQYSPEVLTAPKTLLFCHSLQYLDEDASLLISKIKELAPKNVVTVMNVNKGLLASIIDWGYTNLDHCNPEISVPGFPGPGYLLDKSWEIEATLKAPDFDTLTTHIAYLLDAEIDAMEHYKLTEFLQQRMTYPELHIRQEVRVYTSHE